MLQTCHDAYNHDQITIKISEIWLLLCCIKYSSMFQIKTTYHQVTYKHIVGNMFQHFTGVIGILHCCHCTWLILLLLLETRFVKNFLVSHQIIISLKVLDESKNFQLVILRKTYFNSKNDNRFRFKRSYQVFWFFELRRMS